MENMSIDLEQIKQQQAEALQAIYEKPQVVSKAIDLTNAQYGYNLSGVVTELETYFEKHNIFVKKLSRVGPAGGQVGLYAEWKEVTSVVNGMTSSYEGGTGAYNTTVSAHRQKQYKTMAIRDYVTHEAQITGNGFQDNFGSSIIRALRTFRKAEEYKILGGNITAIAAPSAFTAQASSGGSISAGVYSIKICSMTAECLQGLEQNNNKTGLTLKDFLDSSGDAVSGQYWGVSAPSSADTVTTTSSNGKVTITITPVITAFAYAIFMKTGSDDYTLQTISSYSTAILTNYYTNGQIIGSVDGTTDTLSYDGLLPTIVAATSENGVGGDNSYGQLTAAETGCVEINTDLQTMFDLYGIDITDIYVSGDLRETITKSLINKGAVFAMTQPNELSAMRAGRQVGTYIHPATGELINIHTHRYLPKGTIMGLTETVDMPEVGVGSLTEMHIGQDYFQWDVPSTTRKKEFEIFNYSVLGMRAPLWNFVRKNIKSGLSS